MKAANSLIDALVVIADELAAADMTLENARMAYERRLNTVAIRALSKPLFAPKKDEAGLRPAANDKERDLAIKQLVNADRRLHTLRAAYKDALHRRQMVYNRQKNLRLVAELTIVEAQTVSA